MAPSVVHLPNGHNVTVTPVFGGLYFKSVELNNNHTPFPPGWTIILNSEDDEEPETEGRTSSNSPDRDGSIAELGARRKHQVHRFRKPSLRNDHLFISSISNPSSSEFKPVVSPTRQIAMMLWTSLWWYFHQQEPEPQITSSSSAKTADAGKPKGEWRVTINREGIFKGKHTLQKLERMGLITNADSCVGTDENDANSESWAHTFVSKRHFWQLDARIYLFTLSPALNSPYPSGSPANSRPGSRPGSPSQQAHSLSEPVTPPLGAQQGLWSTHSPGPFQSTSHLPTYYPPAPAQYVFTDQIRHPLRPKPPRQGELFYTRYIPSLGEYLSFRVASLSKRPVPHSGAVSNPSQLSPSAGFALRNVMSAGESIQSPTNGSSSDVELLHRWMNDPRVAYSWGEDGPVEHQQSFLGGGLRNRHSFPVIGCFDGKPFGYFEIYWVKEDRLGAYLGGNIEDYDRGIHCLVGEQQFRGAHRVKVWLSALVHWCWLADSRTNTVMLEPRVDNEKLRGYCEEVGFYKEREISFPHKQSNLMKIKRETWDAPAL